MNIVVLTGKLTADPELKYTQSGKAWIKFSLAVQRNYKKDEVDFINCVAWDKTAELIAEYLRKGNKAGFEGSIRTGSYEKDGKKVYTTDINVSRIEFLESKKDKSTNDEIDSEFPFS